MKAIVCISSLFVLAWTALAQGTVQVVAPGGFANVEGNSSTLNPFASSSARFQQVYSSSEFNFGAPTGRIDGISFRFDGATGQRFIGSWQGVTVFVSTTTRSPDSLSPVFDDNFGTDSTFVRGGALGIFATNSSLQPRSFEIRIPFTTPYFYDPSKGNLAIDITTSPGVADLFLDGHSASDGVGRVFAHSFNATVGTVDTLGLVTRFDFTPIPEPSIALLTVGAAFFVALTGFFRMRELREKARRAL